MDAAVIASMVKWPNVPDCFGWLHLDAQGRWRLGELSAGQAASIVEHEGLKHFINRNYGAMPSGAWALQNGPQRVWVTLALAPLIANLHAGVLSAHTEQVLLVQAVYAASDGVVYFATDGGAAALASRSMDTFAAGLAQVGDDWYWQQNSDTAPLVLRECAAHAVETILGFKRMAQT